MGNELSKGVLKALRSLKDTPVSLRELSRAAGVSPSVVSRLMSGEYSVGTHHAEAIRDALIELRDEYMAAADDMDRLARLIERAQRKGAGR